MLGSASAHVTQYLPHIVQVIQDFHYWNLGMAMPSRFPTRKLVGGGTPKLLTVKALNTSFVELLSI